MGFEKLELLTGILEQQIEEQAKTAEQAKRDMHEHNGAKQALAQIAKQFMGLSASIEERIDKDDDLGSAADKVLVYSKNIFARVITMCEANSKAQHQQQFIAQGRMEAALQSINLAQKKIATQKAFVEQREKAEAEQLTEAEKAAIEDRVKKEAQEARDEAEKEVNGILDKIRNTPSKGNGVPKKKKAAAKKRGRRKATKAKPAPQKPSAEGVPSTPETGDTAATPDGDHT